MKIIITMLNKIFFTIFILTILITACSKENTDKTLIFSKLYNTPENSLVINEYIYSGLPCDPSWYINNTEDINLIKEKIKTLEKVEKDERDHTWGGFGISNYGIHDFPKRIEIGNRQISILHFNNNLEYFTDTKHEFYIFIKELTEKYEPHVLEGCPLPRGRK